jgi:hypothetical protein
MKARRTKVRLVYHKLHLDEPQAFADADAVVTDSEIIVDRGQVTSSLIDGVELSFPYRFDRKTGKKIEPPLPTGWQLSRPSLHKINDV